MKQPACLSQQSGRTLPGMGRNRYEWGVRACCGKEVSRSFRADISVPERRKGSRPTERGTAKACVGAGGERESVRWRRVCNENNSCRYNKRSKGWDYDC